MNRWIWSMLVAAMVSLPAAAQGDSIGRFPPPNPNPDPAAGADKPATPRLSNAQLRDVAIKTLLKAAVGPNAAIRANALEALKDHASLSYPMCKRALADPKAVVRFAAVVIIGSNTPKHPEFKKLVDRVYPLMKDPNPSVRAASLYALHRMGEPINISPLAVMIDTGDSKLRGNVALLLGLMGDKSATALLRRAARIRQPKESGLESALVRIQIAEAAVKLGDNDSLDSLRAGMWSQYGDVRLLAISAVGAVNDRQMSPHLRNLILDPDTKVAPNSPEPIKIAAERQTKVLQLIASTSLARMRSEQGKPYVLRYAADADPIVRKEAASALAWIAGEEARAALQKLLVDPTDYVRVQAAASLVKRVAENRP